MKPYTEEEFYRCFSRYAYRCAETPFMRIVRIVGGMLKVTIVLMAASLLVVVAAIVIDYLQ